MLLSSHPLTVSSPAIPPFLGAPALEPVRSRELTKDGGNSSQSGIDGVNPELVGRKTIYEMNHHTSQRTRHEVSQWELLANRQNGKTARVPM